MRNISIEELKELSQQIPEKLPYLKMLVLFGSRARGDIHSKSDWDFAVIYDEEMRNKLCHDPAFLSFEIPSILDDIFNLNSDHIDVIELNKCSPHIADAVARHGKLIYEQKQGLFDNFNQKFLLTDGQKKDMRQELKQEIDDFLHKWGVIA